MVLTSCNKISSKDYYWRQLQGLHIQPGDKWEQQQITIKEKHTSYEKDTDQCLIYGLDMNIKSQNSIPPVD